MNTRAILLSLLTLGFAVAGWSQSAERFTFASGSRLWITGTSTVHDWECEAEQLTGTVDAEPAADRVSGISGISVTVPVARIDCDNGIMNGKMRDALRASANPSIRYALTSARVGTVNGGRFGIEATGQLTIAGTTRTVRVQAQGQALSNGRYRVTGTVPVTMSEYGVEPPTAMMGTLHTGDRVTVHFDVTISR